MYAYIYMYIYLYMYLCMPVTFVYVYTYLYTYTVDLQKVRQRLTENVEAFAASSTYMRELEMQLFSKNGMKKGDANSVAQKRIACLQAEVRM